MNSNMLRPISMGDDKISKVTRMFRAELVPVGSRQLDLLTGRLKDSNKVFLIQTLTEKDI